MRTVDEIEFIISLFSTGNRGFPGNNACNDMSTPLRTTCLFFLIFLSFVWNGLQAQRYTISGYITDKDNGEHLIGANVFDKQTLGGCVSNNYGFYSLTHEGGRVAIVVSYLGYEDLETELGLAGDTTINFELEVSSSEIEQVTVVGNKRSKVEDTQMSMIDIPIATLQKVPVLFGEADVLKVIQLLPGVQSGTEGSTGIYVRGGGPDQNLFLLDGVPVYNASHLFGFFSVFNPDAVKTVQLYKGGFPARFGERLSSVIDIRMKDGNMKKYQGSFSVGLIASKFYLEGPIKKDRTSFILSARRTYADLLARPFIAASNAQRDDKFTGGYYFYDVNAKVNHKFSEKSRLFLSAYLGNDEAYGKDKYRDDYGNPADRNEYTDKFGLGWGNIISALRWNYLLTNRLFSNTTVTYSRYIFDVHDEAESKNLASGERNLDFFRYFSGIEDVSARLDFDYYPSAAHTVKFGTSYTYHDFKPGVTRLKFDFGDESSRIDTTIGNETIDAGEWVAYAEDNIRIGSAVRVNAGVHFAAFNVQDTTYTSLQPRLSVRVLAGDGLSFKASYSRMAQFVHLLTTSAISLPTDLWLPVTRKFEPPVSDQFAVGMSAQLPKGLDLTVEGFYKTMENLIEYKEGASFGSSGSSWETKVEKGRGWSYGGEFLLEKNTGKTTGWIGYTLSWTNRQFENLNFGRVFPAKYDRRHDISVVVTHEFSKQFDIGLTWVYGTGNAATLGVMEYPSPNIPGIFGRSYYGPLTEYEGRNNYRTPAYHRLDLGLNFNKELRRGVRTWNISVYNAYNRKNPFFVNWGSDETINDSGDYVSKPVLKQYSLFPMIPSVSYSFRF